jgi:hypothetical protein
VRGNERGGHRQYASARGMRPDGTESTLSHGDRGFESRFPASWSSRSSPPRDGAPHRRPIDAIDGVAILGELHDELVEGLADDRRRGATLRGCLDVGVSRVICVFNPADGTPCPTLGIDEEFGAWTKPSPSERHTGRSGQTLVSTSSNPSGPLQHCNTATVTGPPPGRPAPFGSRAKPTASPPRSCISPQSRRPDRGLGYKASGL